MQHSSAPAEQSTQVAARPPAKQPQATQPQATPRAATPQQTTLQPATPGRARALSRMVGIDFARFIAIVGMMCAHLLPAGTPGFFLWDGNASTLFAVIGGISVILATRRYLNNGEVAAARLAMAARGIIVMAIGLALAELGGPIMIVLVYFGAAMIVTIPFLRAGNKTLLITAGILAVVGPLASGFVSTGVEAGTEIHALSVGTFGDPIGVLRNLMLTGYYPVVTWVVYLLVGMVVGRWVLDAQKNGTEPRLTLSMTAVGSTMIVATTVISEFVREAIAVPALLAGGLDDGELELLATTGVSKHFAAGEWWRYFLNTPHTGLTLDIVRGIGVALLLIAAALWFARTASPRVLRLLRPASAAGTAPLTIYTLHVAAVGVSFIVFQVLVELESRTDLDFGVSYTNFPWWLQSGWMLLIHVTVALLIGLILALSGKKGPLETLVTFVAGRTARLAGRGKRKAAAAAVAAAEAAAEAATETGAEAEPTTTTDAVIAAGLGAAQSGAVVSESPEAREIEPARP